MIDLAGWPYFFARITVGLTISFAKAVNIAIDRAVLMKRDVAIGFSKFSL